MDELELETEYGRVYGRVTGQPDAPLLVGIHGWSQRNGWHTWEPLMQPLAAGGYYVVSVDMPGWGRSTSTHGGPLSQQEAIAVLEAIITGLGRNEARAILGKSWGGGIALALALAKPQRVQRLVLTAPAFMEFDSLAGLQQPVLLAWAKDDPAIPYSMAAQFVAAVSRLDLVTYETGGHSAAPNNAGDFAPRALEFLRSSNVEKQS